MSKSRSKRCNSPGILQNFKSNDQTQSSRCSKELNISVHDPYVPTDPKEAEAEKRRFEELKKQYFDKCAHINKNLVLRSNQSVDNDDIDNDDTEMQIFKTIRGNPKAIDFSKNKAIKHQDVMDFRKHASRVDTKNLKDVDGRGSRRGCGTAGCDCLDCVCGVRCQIDCKCMRKM